MKKLAAIILSLAMVFSLCACEDKAETPASGGDTQTSETPAPAPAVPSDNAVQVPESTEDESEEIMELYKNVLRGKQEFVIGKDITGFEEGDSYLLPQFSDVCVEDMNEEWETEHTCTTSYAFLDCGLDGIPEMSVRLEMSDEYSDSHVRFFILNSLEGTPTVIADYDFYYRSYASINEAGLVEYGGSGGAFLYSDDYRYINAEGEEVFLYSCYTEMGNYIPAISSYYLPDMEGYDYDRFIGEDIDEYYTVVAYNFSDFNVSEEDPNYDEAYKEYVLGNFFVITDDYSNDVAPAEEYAAKYEEYGVKIYTQEEASEMIQAHLKEMGVTDEILSADYIEYTVLDEAKINDDVIENNDGSVTVGCAANLIDNIKDGATIYLKPGVYNLSDWCDIYESEYADTYYHRCRTYPDAFNYGDHIFIAGGQVIVNRINDLTIASLDPENPAEIVTDDMFNMVLSFCECSDLTIRDVVAGHSAGNEGHCSADVFEFTECDRVTLEYCDLYGCGCFGICANDTCVLDVTGGRIHDCTIGMAEIYGTAPVNFTDVCFENCSESWSSMFCLSDSSADFNNCSFSGLGDMFYMNESSAWLFGCTLDEAAEESVRTSEYFENSLYMYD